MHDLSKSASLCIFSLIAIALMTLHGSWFDADQRIPFWDQFRYLEMSERAYEVLDAEPHPLTGHILDLHPSHPPLYSLSGALAMRVTEPDFAHARFINLTWTLCLLLSTFALARQFMGRGHSLLATALAGFAPLTTSFAHLYYIETMLAPLVICSWWLILASHHLTRWPYVVALGITLGLGCLTKWTFPVFLAIPIAVEAWPLIKSRNFERIAALIAIPLLIAGPWYFFHCQDIIDFFSAGVTGGEGFLSSRSGLRQYTFYFEELVLVGLGIPFALFAGFGLIRIYRHHPKRAQTWLITLGIAVPILVFTFVLTKKPRHLLPILPLFAVLASFGLSTLKWAGLGRALSACLLIHVVLCTLNASFDALPKLSLRGYEIPVFSRPSPSPGPPDSAIWPYETIIKQAVERPLTSGNRASLHTTGLVLFNLVPFREVGFRYQIKRMGLDAWFSLVPMYWPDGHPARNPFPILRSDFETPGLVDADVVIGKSGITWVRYGNKFTPGRFGAVISEALRQPKGPLAPAFTLVTPPEGIPCPDGSVAWAFAPSNDLEREQVIAKFSLRWQPDSPAAWAALGEPVPNLSSEALGQRLEALGVRPSGWHAALNSLATSSSATEMQRSQAINLIQSALHLPEREDLWREAAARLPQGLTLSQEIATVLELWQGARTDERDLDHVIQLAKLHYRAGRRACALAWARRAIEDNSTLHASAAAEILRDLGQGSPPDRRNMLKWVRGLSLEQAELPR